LLDLISPLHPEEGPPLATTSPCFAAIALVKAPFSWPKVRSRGGRQG
jgi:hypothetical protein